jgi:phosphoribosylglycinamide formyltransferase-1
MEKPARLVILISGNGSNLQAVLEACETGILSAQVVTVISNRRDAYGLTRARNAGVPAIVLERLPGEDRHAYDNRLAEEVSLHEPDYVILAGWMRLLTATFLDRFPKRVINLHPALPGTFPGTHAIERAFEAHQQGKIDRTGIMVHLVPDEGVDDGPALATQEIFFREDETLVQFEARMHTEEHHLLVNTLRILLDMDETIVL